MKVFVFGSNLAGRHGAGAAKHAVLEKGADYGQGVGFQGRSYAIPTKGYNLELLQLDRIALYVNQFIDFAIAHPQLTFQVTAIGCGLARGNKSREDRIREIAPLFQRAKNYRNIELPKEFGGDSRFISDDSYNVLDDIKRADDKFDELVKAGLLKSYVNRDDNTDQFQFIGIVGSSKPAKAFENYRPVIDKILSKYEPLTTVIASGGAKGVDTFAVNRAKEKGFKTIEFKPTQYNWEGFKKRNLELADKCSKIYCIVEPVKDTKCYHCSNNNLDNDHQKTAGCWTATKCKNYEIIRCKLYFTV